MTARRQRKLLFLLPFPPDLRGSHGGARATAAMIEMLSKDHRVCVLYLSADGDPPARELPGGCETMEAVETDQPNTAAHSLTRSISDAFGGLGWREPQWVRASWSPQMAGRAEALAQAFEPNLVHFEFHVMAQYIPVIRAAFPPAKCIVTEHEPGITADERAAVLLTVRQRLGRLRRRLAWYRYERRALARADAILVFTKKDAAEIARLLGPGARPVTVIPLRLPEIASPRARGGAPITSDILFVGNFRHPPNVDAARRLVGDIFPLIQRKSPDAKLMIVGADPPQELIAAASDHVDVTGWVDDPSLYVMGAAVVLVPLRQGGGLRVKMLEACAAGKAIVASPMAVEGLTLADGVEVMLAETDLEFADQAIELLADPEKRTRLEEASRKWSEREQDSGHWAAQYANFYEAVESGSKGDDADPSASGAQ